MAIIAIVRGSIASSLVLVLVFKVAHYAGRLITPGATVTRRVLWCQNLDSVPSAARSSANELRRNKSRERLVSPQPCPHADRFCIPRSLNETHARERLEQREAAMLSAQVRTGTLLTRQLRPPNVAVPKLKPTPKPLR
jgi:hypothetical protein